MSKLFATLLIIMLLHLSKSIAKTFFSYVFFDTDSENGVRIYPTGFFVTYIFLFKKLYFLLMIILIFVSFVMSKKFMLNSIAIPYELFIYI